MSSWAKATASPLPQQACEISSAVQDGGEVEDVIRLGQRVVTGLLAERAFASQGFKVSRRPT